MSQFPHRKQPPARSSNEITQMCQWSLSVYWINQASRERRDIGGDKKLQASYRLGECWCHGLLLGWARLNGRLQHVNKNFLKIFSQYSPDFLLSITNFMKPSRREANSCSATQETPSMLWNPKFLYLKPDKSSPFIPILIFYDPFNIKLPSTPKSL
jgi:hypothetical protein